jgi:hypothetical protein
LTDGEREWERCRPWLEAALAHDGGFHDLVDVAKAIEAGEAHFWPGERSAVVTQFWNFPRRKAVNVWLAGGDLSELVDQMRPDIEAWARAHGCTHFIIAGRPGWARALKASGFAPLWTALGKELT